MFGNDERDKKNALLLMQREAMELCRFNETQAIQRTASWIANDRRFDGVNSETLAKEVFNAARSGRSIRLDGAPYRPQGGGVSV